MAHPLLLEQKISLLIYTIKQYKILRLLKEYGLPASQLKTPLELAIRLKDAATLKQLLELGADSNLPLIDFTHKPYLSLFALPVDLKVEGRPRNSQIIVPVRTRSQPLFR